MLAYFDYRPEYRRLREELDAAWRRVLESGRLVLGPEVEAFEAEFAAWLGVAHGVGTNSGTDALILALRALGIGPGDEVITVANAGVPTVAAVRAVGAFPRLVDVDPRGLLLDPARLAAAATPRTRCVIPVHLYGQAAPLDEVLGFARERGLRVVEDCAQAHGTTYRGRPVGSFGDAGCFSFYPTKNLGA
jgi:dTDP-4-amino-4,6-dideoxygalactose transaminase